MKGDQDESVREAVLQTIVAIEAIQVDWEEARARQERHRTEMAEREAVARAEREAQAEKDRAEEELKGLLEERMTTVVGAIRDSVAQAMGLQSALRVGTTADDGVYASVRMGLVQSMRQTLELRQEHLPVGLNVREGETLEEMHERMRALNFLVLHEMGHVVQDERAIPEKTVDPKRFAALDGKRVVHNANEIFIDKLAFDLAVKVYVHGDGDMLFDERVREIVFIHSYLVMGGIIYRHHRTEKFVQRDEAVARVVAVLRELAMSKAVTRAVQAELRDLARDFEANVGEGATAAKQKGFRRLIKAYRNIFRASSLEV